MIVQRVHVELGTLMRNVGLEKRCCNDTQSRTVCTQSIFFPVVTLSLIVALIVVEVR